MTDFPHVSDAELDGYLRHTLPPDHHQRVHTHLDSCEPCWDTWNHHRWDSAITSPVCRQLVEFLGPDFQPYVDSSRALANDWDSANPRTEHDIAHFFRTSTSYLYNLAIWEASGNRPPYAADALPTLTCREITTVLDYGCGIGSDAIPLRRNGFNVLGCDFHSPSTAFLRWRSHDTIPLIEPGEITSVAAPDALWVIDTLDHLTDIEAALGGLLPVVRLMVTENLTINRGHGRQGFHIRRPLAELTALFADFGLTPTATAPTDAVMFWERTV